MLLRSPPGRLRKLAGMSVAVAMGCGLWMLPTLWDSFNAHTRHWIVVAVVRGSIPIGYIVEKLSATSTLALAWALVGLD